MLWLGVLAALLLVVSLSAGYGNLISPLTVIAAVSITIGIGSIPLLKSYQYTAWIMLAFVCGMIYPSAFLQWGSFDLRNKWLILIVVQLVMFGMGTQMSLKDFEWAMGEMMQDRDYLYSSMKKDLYFLGLVLDKKYKILRLTYSVFMVGIIVSVTAFAIAFKTSGAGI